MEIKRINKPELLLPVGNTEAFYAALEGGADAIYVGLKNFNARGRAANFNHYQLLSLLDEASKRNIKVYLTLNTVIKNKELSELLDVLWFLSKTKVAAVIIQDWGTYYLIKKHFTNLVIHASTQMATHNSAGTRYCKKIGIERAILARELTFSELTEIQKKSPVETEIFVHGALCYSFSGMCQFSSYLSGAGANRGLCAQPCRRYYQTDRSKKLIFSLKDNQLVDYIPEFTKLGIHSLKIEGRLKSAEYVFQTARAYRQAIDHPEKQGEAKTWLNADLGREKTEWFYSNLVAESITDNPNTGLLIGSVLSIDHESMTIRSSVALQHGNRLRMRTAGDNDQEMIKVDNFKLNSDQTYTIFTSTQGIKAGVPVFLIRTGQKKFPSRLKSEPKPVSTQMPVAVKKNILSNLRRFTGSKKTSLFIRIDHIDWLKFIHADEFDQIIINLCKTQWKSLFSENALLQKYKQKLWIELPGFIPEKSLAFYRKSCEELQKKGLNQFSISHLSQIELLPTGVRFGTNEQVYAFNDAAVTQILTEGAKWLMSPSENEFDNLLTGSYLNQIIPLYFYPRLFFSRMPVQSVSKGFTDETKQRFRKVIRNGITLIIPEKPVSLLQYRDKLAKKGFSQFLIDVSFISPGSKVLRELSDRFKKSESLQPSTSYNFKKGLR